MRTGRSHKLAMMYLGLWIALLSWMVMNSATWASRAAAKQQPGSCVSMNPDYDVDAISTGPAQWEFRVRSSTCGDHVMWSMNDMWPGQLHPFEAVTLSKSGRTVLVFQPFMETYGVPLGIRCLAPSGAIGFTPYKALVGFPKGMNPLEWFHPQFRSRLWAESVTVINQGILLRTTGIYSFVIDPETGRVVSRQLCVHRLISVVFGGCTLGAITILTGRALLLALCSIRRSIIRKRRSRAGSCVHCGYSLRGLDKSRCPECGNAIPVCEEVMGVHPENSIPGKKGSAEGVN